MYLDVATNKWYLYGWGDDDIQPYPERHAHPFVAESTTGPLGPFTWKATLSSPNDGMDTYGYCASPIKIGSTLYLSQTDNGKIYLAKMTNPWTISTSAPSDPSGWNLIAEPTEPWGCTVGEFGGTRCINEGGTVVVKGNYAYILFMAGGYESPDYSVGMLRADITQNLLLKATWTKSQVYTKNVAKGAYGPSLNWFKSPNGTEDWVVGHVAYSSAFNAFRQLQYKRVTWSAATPAVPTFGSPYALDEYPSPLLPAGDPGYTTGIYEAESAVKAGCSNVASTTASGGSYVGGIDAVNDKVTFTVNVTTPPGAGTYLLRVYYGNVSATTATQTLSINGVTPELPISYPQTTTLGHFPDDKYAVIGVKLNAG